MQLAHEYIEDLEHRFRYVNVVAILFFVIVFGRLYYLQIMQGEFYRFFSTENSIKELKMPAPRGVILDRRGQVLADNRPAFDIVIVPQYIVNPARVFSTLEVLLGIPREKLDALWNERYRQAPYQPLVLFPDAPLDKVSLIRGRQLPWHSDENLFDLRGVEVRPRYLRSYPDGEAVTHVVGYVREVDAKKLEETRETYPGRYEMGDLVGIQGIEQGWDIHLRGFDGFSQRVVDAGGRAVHYEGIADQLEDRQPIAGSNLYLTIERDLQMVAKELFAQRAGAAVVVDVHTGAIRAFYSAPSYDLNRLVSPEGSLYWQELATDQAKPLLVRPIHGAYPPGSTYKIVTGLAALSEGVVKTDETIVCRGALIFGGRPFHCWAKGGHGAISFHNALVRSCDVYFYLMGLRLGVDRLAEYATLFGLGQKTGIEFANERSGLIPTSAWKEKRFKEPWQEGETLSISVGQGYDLVTPLQSALMIARVVNGGHPLQPQLIERMVSVDGKIEAQLPPPSSEPIGKVSPDVLRQVKDALVGVVAEVGGTAHAQSRRPITMGGKTGTAQVVSLGKECAGDACRDHAWFVGFAPAENPQVAAAVIVEHGGFGASAAAPIVGALLEKYLSIE